MILRTLVHILLYPTPMAGPAHQCRIIYLMKASQVWQVQGLVSDSGTPPLL